MKNASNILRISMILLTIVIAILLISFVLNAIEATGSNDASVKATLVIGITALSFIAISALATSSNKQD